jgi:hypothetical protein
MSFSNDLTAKLCRAVVAVAALIVLVSCGSGSTPTTTTPTPTPTPVNNTATVTVGFGALGASGGYVNGIFTTVTVCAPGSSTNCVNIPNVLVDTGSVGLRVLQSALGTLATALPQVQNTSNNVLQECVQFADFSYVWGPLAYANVSIAGETAGQVPLAGALSGIPIHIITNPPTYPVPANCLVSSGNANSPSIADNTLATLGANGILGIENFPEDCGPLCTGSSGNVPAQYYLCPGGVCTVAQVPLGLQVWNPVAAFTGSDFNGVVITLPSVPATGAASVTGSLIFGIGTQSNNALGSATLYGQNSFGNFQTTYNGNTYVSFIDSASNAFYFADAATLGSAGIVECTGALLGYYCPAAPVPFTVTNKDGLTGTVSGPVNFTIANAATLLNSGNAVYSNLGGDSGSGLSTDYFDFGLPFFLGKTVFVGMASTNASYPYGYWAY